jgi:cytochrome c5
MKPVFIICIAVFAFLSCAKKTTPAASTTTTAPTETKAPDEIKTEAAATESTMSVAGHTTFDAKCGRCHGLKNPGDYTAKQWVPILDKMASKARLDSTEKANVLAYVSFHAKAGS